MVVFLIIIITVSAVACGKGPEEPIDDVPETTEPQDTPADEEPDPRTHMPIRVTGNLHNNLVVESGAKTARGYYEILRWPEQMMPENHRYVWYGNILYTDYESQQQIYLCNMPGCAHNTEECTSFVEYTGNITLFTDYSENHLYMISGGESTYEYRTEEELPRIIEMDMDGSNRRTVCVFNSNEGIPSNSVEIASDEYVYIRTERTYYANGPQTYGPQTANAIERVWFADGRREEIRRLDNSTNAYEIAKSVYGDQDLILQVNGVEDDVMYLKYIRVDQDGKTIEEYGPYTEITMYTFYGDNHLFLADHDGKTGYITYNDLTTGESRTVTGIPALAQGARGRGKIMCFGADGYKINWWYIDKETDRDKVFLVDTQVGTWKEFTPRLDSERDKPVAVIAEAGDDYLVVVGEKKTYITMTNKDGVIYNIWDERYPVRALMSKEDYWNSTPNYRTIDDIS